MNEETRITHRIQAHVRAKGGVCIKFHGNALTQKNVPDLWGTYAGRPFAIEVKAPGRFARPGQQSYLRKLSEHGYVTGVVYDVASFAALFAGGK